MTPSDNRALAHVPVADGLVRVTTIWLALASNYCRHFGGKIAVNMAEHLLPIKSPLQNQTQHESVFVRAQSLLQQWMQAAHELPVHDVRSNLASGDVLARYAQRASDSDRAQVLGNVMAFWNSPQP